MKLEMLAVHDRSLNAYMRPFFAQTVGQAQRMFGDEINNPQGDMNKHPDDYDLWHLGTWDDESGKIEEGEPKQIAIGKNLLIQKQ